MKLAVVIDGGIFIRVGADLHPVETEFAVQLASDLGDAIKQANEFFTKQLMMREMPMGREFRAKLRLDLRDAYGDVYYRKDEEVTVFKRTAMPGTAESVLKYPYAIGSFHVDAAAFDPL